MCDPDVETRGSPANGNRAFYRSAPGPGRFLGRVRLIGTSWPGRFRKPIHGGASRSRCTGVSLKSSSGRALEALRRGSASRPNGASAGRRKTARWTATGGLGHLLASIRSLGRPSALNYCKCSLVRTCRIASGGLPPVAMPYGRAESTTSPLQPSQHAQREKQASMKRRGGLRESIHGGEHRERPAERRSKRSVARRGR